MVVHFSALVLGIYITIKKSGVSKVLWKENKSFMKSNAQKNGRILI